MNFLGKYDIKIDDHFNSVLDVEFFADGNFEMVQHVGGVPVLVRGVFVVRQDAEKREILVLVGLVNNAMPFTLEIGMKDQTYGIGMEDRLRYSIERR